MKRITSVLVNQFSFMPGRSNVGAIYLLMRLVEKYRENKKDIHVVFIERTRKTYIGFLDILFSGFGR